MEKEDKGEKGKRDGRAKRKYNKESFLKPYRRQEIKGVRMRRKMRVEDEEDGNVIENPDMEQEVNFGAASSSSPINQDPREKRSTENNSKLLDSLSTSSLQVSLIGAGSIGELSAERDKTSSEVTDLLKF